MFSKALFAAGLIGAASALPTENTYPSSQLIKANFDDIETVPGVPLLTFSGKYKHLNFKDWEVTQIGVLGADVTGITPNTPKNVLAHGVQDDLLQGEAYVVVDDVKSFDLKKFYFACVVDSAASAASLPAGCKLTVDGYQGSRGVANQEFTFTPNGVESSMQEAKLSSDFKHLDRVTFHFDDPLKPVTSLLVDSFEYTVSNGHYYM